jgi:hypothetical protein
MINPEELAYREPPKRKFQFRLPSFRKPPVPNKKYVLITSLFISGIVLGAGGIFGWQYYKNLPPPTVAEVPDDKPPQDVLGLIESVEKDVPSIPKNEIPSVATIKDLDSLSDQAFFEGAVEGDRLMIYTVNKRAFLYRPSTGKVVRQGPVEVIGEEDENAPASASAVLSASDSAKEAPALRIKY